MQKRAPFAQPGDRQRTLTQKNRTSPIQGRLQLRAVVPYQVEEMRALFLLRPRRLLCRQVREPCHRNCVCFVPLLSSVLSGLVQSDEEVWWRRIKTSPIGLGIPRHLAAAAATLSS